EAQAWQRLVGETCEQLSPPLLSTTHTPAVATFLGTLQSLQWLSAPTMQAPPGPIDTHDFVHWLGQTVSTYAPRLSGTRLRLVAPALPLPWAFHPSAWEPLLWALIHMAQGWAYTHEELRLSLALTETDEPQLLLRIIQAGGGPPNTQLQAWLRGSDEETPLMRESLVLRKAQATLQALNGTLSAQSTPALGAVLTVRVPLPDLDPHVVALWRNQSSPDRIEAPTPQAVPASFVASVNQLIEQNLQNEDFHVIHLEKAFGISRPVLIKRLKALTGKTVVEYIREYRLQRAADLLQKPELSIAEVAYQVGFSDPKYFSRSFKKLYRKSPSEWRG
ncbi:MAG TPA: hypothetical protein DCE41_05835, partial [Cytophagales bacterium]|nr:hypothetical protein [Cytophagales bacterium]